MRSIIWALFLLLVAGSPQASSRSVGKPRKPSTWTDDDRAGRIDKRRRRDDGATTGLSRNAHNAVAVAAATPLSSVAPSSKSSSLFLVNLCMFFFYAVLGSVMPFIPLYYSYLGVADEHIGTLGAITPTVTFLVSPLWGALADSTGLEKEIMMATFFLSTVIRFGLVYVKNFPNLATAISVLVALSAVINAPVKPLLDACTMALLKDKSSFGRSRLYGQVGFGFGSWLVGPFLGRADIRNIFVVQMLLAVPTAILMFAFVRVAAPSELEKKTALKAKQAKQLAEAAEAKRRKGSSNSSVSSPSDFSSALRHVATNKHILIFFFSVFLLGISSGIIENFAYVHLKDCGGYDGTVLGICRLASSLAGVPMFYMAGPILNAMGVNGILLTCMVAYVMRFALYATMTSTWQALPAEVLRGATFALFTTGSTYYVYNASPPALVATMLSLLSGTYNGLGQSVGSLLGGLFSKRYGIVRVFTLCALTDAVLAGLFIVYLGWQKRASASAPASPGDAKKRSLGSTKQR